MLELAIGTGRIALPLAATGVRVDGVDLSQPMVDQLRAKPGGSEIAVTIGDFCDVELDERYALVYVVFNSFSNVLTQDDQVRAFENVARHLTDDGVFVMEMGLPSVLIGMRNDQYVEAEAIGVDEVRLDLLRVDRRPRSSRRTTSRSRRRASASTPSCSATRGPPSSTSWPGSPASASTPATGAGRGSPSPGRASSTSPSGAADPGRRQAIGRS